MIRTPDFREVTPTADELATWRKGEARQHGGYTPTYGPSVYRSECRYCGKRIWHSGLAVASHRRACEGEGRRGSYAKES